MTDDTLNFIGAVLAGALLSLWGVFTWLGRREKAEDAGLSFWIDDPSEDEGEPMEPRMNGRRP